MIECRTINNTVTLQVKGTEFVIVSKSPKLKVSIDACMIFDELTKLKINSKHYGIRRRARQINGMSFQAALDTINNRI